MAGFEIAVESVIGQVKDRSEVVLVVHTFREAGVAEWLIRIISAWKATKKEIKRYEEL